MRVLLHICCALCSAACIKILREENIDITGYWYNPNIHPYKEYENRLNALKEYSKLINLDVIYNDYYGLREFSKNVINILDNRCGYCYLSRLENVVKYAKDNGYDAFTTTLFISPYQKHDLLKKICEDLSRKYDIKFLYRDFRPYFYEGKKMFKETGLYMQKYCGCVFSEESSNYDNIISASKDAILHNKETEKRIRLGWSVPNLELKPYKNGNQDEIQFIYNLKKEVYKKYVEKYYGEWNEQNQRKLFDRFMKENLKNIELIYLKGELVGFYNGKEKEGNIFEIGNICVKPEYQNKGIGTAVLNEILFENKGNEIVLQCFKDNPAIELYMRLGFEKINETEKHYIMKKSID